MSLIVCDDQNGSDYHCQHYKILKGHTHRLNWKRIKVMVLNVQIYIRCIIGLHELKLDLEIHEGPLIIMKLDL